MSDSPKFQDLVGEGLPPTEHERLERVHEMLIEAGPPPELPPELEEVPDGRGAAAARSVSRPACPGAVSARRSPSRRPSR